MTGKSEITSQNHGFNVVRADAEKKYRSGNHARTPQ